MASKSFELQWNPDVTNSERNQKIVRYIGSSLNREKTFFGSFRSSRLNNLRLACLGYLLLLCTFTKKTKLNSKISNGWSYEMKIFMFFLLFGTKRLAKLVSLHF